MGACLVFSWLLCRALAWGREIQIQTQNPAGCLLHQPLTPWHLSSFICEIFRAESPCLQLRVNPVGWSPESDMVASCLQSQHREVEAGGQLGSHCKTLSPEHRVWVCGSWVEQVVPPITLEPSAGISCLAAWCWSKQGLPVSDTNGFSPLSVYI